LRLAALLATALWLAQSAAVYLDFAMHRHVNYQLSALSAALFAACAAGACLAIVSAWLWRSVATVGLALAVTATSVLACSQAQFLSDLLLDVRLIGPPLALAVLAAGKDRLPRRWLPMPAAFLIAPLPALFPDAADWWWPIAFWLFPAAFFAVLGAALVWFAADARPAIAFGLYFEAIYVLRSFAMAPRLAEAPTASQGMIIALLAVALAAAALRVRGTARA
jgi:hypothetical protein